MPSSRARMGRLRPIPDVEFGEDVRDVVLDGAFGEVEPTVRSAGAAHHLEPILRRADVLPTHLPYDVRARPRVLDDDVTWGDMFLQVCRRMLSGRS